MPELPDITVYLEQLERRIVGQLLEKLVIAKPFVLRTFDPPVSEVVGRTVRGVRRMGKRIVLEMDGERFIVIHLMIAGRLKWREVGGKLPPKGSILATFHFPTGVLVLTEAGTARRASMHLVRGEEGLREFDRGGLEVLTLRSRNFRRGFGARTTRSSARWRIRGCSAGSGMRTRMRFCIARGCRR